MENMLKLRHMKIGIDARFFGPSGKGLGRYTQKLIENLEKIDTVNDYVIFLKKENFNDYFLQNKNFKKVLADYPWYSFSEQFCFPWLLRKYKLDLMHFPHFNVPLFYGREFLVTIHDLILIHFPTTKNSTLHPFFYRIKFLAYRLVIGYAIKYSKNIITVSNFTKKDILANYKKIMPEKIKVTYEACENCCFFSTKRQDEILQRYGIIKPYLLYIGNAYPHKNLERLARAFSLLKRRGKLALVLVGREDYFYIRLKKMIEQEKIKNIIFTGYIPDEELELIERYALAYIFPSLYEGFGLPPLEVMAKGVPVICSDHACMREILGESAYFFDGKNEKCIAEAIEKIVSDDDLRKELIEVGYKQIQRYSWEKMAKETLKIYGKIN
jgi:glycosyltransferase involved in cell wall biosynthesis